MTPQNWTEERLAYFSLTHAPGLGTKRLQRLFLFFTSWKQAWTAPVSQLMKTGIPEKILLSFQTFRRNFNLTSALKQLEREKIEVILPDDKEMPYALRQSSDPPPILYVRGSLTELPTIALVGSRNPTSYASHCVDVLVPPLCEAGFATVSGLALGVDGLVHTRTLTEGGTTIALVGSGVDDASLYPATHQPLARSIIEQGGAILSELPPGTRARKEYFPQRNRLIACFASATVVIEATEKSGSLITAKIALEENREVFSVPGPIWSAQSSGTNNLLRLGAHVCTNAHDIFNGLHLDRPEIAIRTQASFPLDPTEERVLESLIEPQHQDALGRMLILTSAQISSVITILELKGLISSLGGNTWVKTSTQTSTHRLTR